MRKTGKLQQRRDVGTYPFGWKHPRACSWRDFQGSFLEEEEYLRKKKIMEEKKGASTPNLFSLFPFPFFFLLMVVFTFL